MMKNVSDGLYVFINYTGKEETVGSVWTPHVLTAYNNG